MAESNAGHPSLPVVSPSPAAVPATNGDIRPAAKSATNKKTAPPPTETKDSLREIIETVVFVVVLVLLLKSFVAEAFVIPTGSMAETLYGYQKLVKCPKCQHEFPVNCSCEVDPQQGPPTRVEGCICPNCRYQINFNTENLHPSWNTGDRVLVAKFVYDLNLLGLNGPSRYQVVVFKYPREPQRDYVPLNYIKRLIGLSGETIAIHYGKLYVCDRVPYPDAERAERDVRLNDLWRREYMRENDREAIAMFEQGAFRMLRKPPPEVLAERRLVFDNDHQPKDLIGKVPPRWMAEPKGPWQADNAETPQAFQINGGPAGETAYLRYRHYIPAHDNRGRAEQELITDFMGYNTWEPEKGYHSLPPQNWVGDLMLECDVKVESAKGSLVLELNKGVDLFRAEWELATGDCTLTRVTDRKEIKLETKNTAMKKPGTYRLRFANVDERLMVWVDGQMPFDDGFIYPSPPHKGPREADLQPASIGAKDASLTVSKIKLWRDTYYTTNIDPSGPDAGEQIDFARPNWEALSKLPVKTLYVQPNHFLCLGDNSPESSDGRSWGTVPRRLLLGRAMLIYYPFFDRAGRIQ